MGRAGREGREGGRERMGRMGPRVKGGGGNLGLSRAGGLGRAATKPDRKLPAAMTDGEERVAGRQAGEGREGASGVQAVARVKAERAVTGGSGGSRPIVSGCRAVARPGGAKGRGGPRPRAEVGTDGLVRIAVPGGRQAATGLEGAAAWEGPRASGHVSKLWNVFSFCTVRPSGGDMGGRLLASKMVAAGAVTTDGSPEVLMVSPQVGSNDAGQECCRCLDAALDA